MQHCGQGIGRSLLLALLGATGGLHAIAGDRGEPQGVEINGLIMQSRIVRDYYPPAMRRTATPGRVSLAYSVDADGRVIRITPLVSDSAAFEPGAVQMLTDMRFAVPKGWEASGGPWRRFRIQVTFVIGGRQPLPVWAEGENVLLVTASAPGRR